MKKILFLFGSILISSFVELCCQELKVTEFNHLVNNTTARIYQKKDINGQNCGVLIIKSNLKDFSIETGKGFEAREDKIGETWLWLSPDEYQLIIRKEGYIPLYYNLKNKINSFETYELVVTDDFGFLKVEAQGSIIWLNNNQVGKNRYETRLIKGDYILKATKINHEDDKKLVTINAGEEIAINLEPIPYQANVIIESKPSETIGSSIFINDFLINKKSPAIIPLTLGEYKITLQKSGFIDNTRIVELKETKNYPLLFEMEKLKTDPIILKHKRNSNIWLASTAIFSGTFIYCYSKKNKLLVEYQNATTNAEDIRDKYKIYSTLYPIALGAAGVSLTNFIIQKVKQKKAINRLNLTYSIELNFNNVGLCYNF